jgi:twitching motility protein PilT
MQINELLKIMLDQNSSDLHVGTRQKPVMRINGELVVQEDMPELSDEDMQQMLLNVASPQQVDYFNKERELDLAYGVPGLARFRVNALLQRGTLSLCFRLIPFKIPALDELGMPEIIKKLALKRKGLILVTGQTGSGKSTTMAAIIRHINETERRNIITIEEPVEFLHQNNKCVISQRQVGQDTDSFSKALIHALRHDPDVIVVGEMRDIDTISTAITAAETGHLVLATLHTFDAPQTVDRIIDVFPSGQQPQVRVQFAQIIEGIISQTLVRRISGGRTAALEIMVGTPATRYLIRDGKTHQIHSTMQSGSKDGMQILDQALASLVSDAVITKEEAELNCADLEQFRMCLSVAG